MGSLTLRIRRGGQSFSHAEVGGRHKKFRGRFYAVA